jgi:5-methylcytosine-specific restriction endonuclease McrA
LRPPRRRFRSACRTITLLAMHAAHSPPVDVAERTLRLLDEGRYSATYKQAVLVALIDLCLESTRHDGTPTDVLTTRQLAERVVALYWPHTRVWATEGTGRILVQNMSGPREKVERGGGIVAKIRIFREELERFAPGTVNLTGARSAHRARYESLVDDVEWALIEMPLPKLQRIGDRNTEWLYRIDWRDTDERDAAHCDKPLPSAAQVRAYQRNLRLKLAASDPDTPSGHSSAASSDFDNRVHLQLGVASAFARLHGLLRPHVLRHWTAQVVRHNKLRDDDVGGFLFEQERQDTSAVRAPLIELQGGRCFYCACQLTGQVHVDHFIPWARHPDNGLHNLVAADSGCNGAKKDYLASLTHLARWRTRAIEHAAGLEAIAAACHWDDGSKRILGVARAIYLALPAQMPHWRGGREFEPSDAASLAQALVA